MNLLTSGSFKSLAKNLGWMNATSWTELLWDHIPKHIFNEIPTKISYPQKMYLYYEHLNIHKANNHN